MSIDTTFHRVLWDDADTTHHPSERTPIDLKPDDQINRVVLCSGKVYYDLLEAREAQELNDVYLMRVEQLYPFPARALIEELGRFPQAKVVWCQEEPRNMGCWSFAEPNIEWVLDHIDAKSKRARYAGRAAAASTATGQLSRHIHEQESLVNDALTG